MPTDTFFRLPEEKRDRIINAAWEEFTSVSFAQVSINRIIRAAEIPRGSFYQYFADKNDLFRYLGSGMKQYALEGYLTVLRRSGGDIFRAALEAYDGVRELQGTPGILPIDRCLAFIRVNPGFDIQKLITDSVSAGYLDPVWEALDVSAFRQNDKTYICTVFHLCLLALGNAVLDALGRGDRWDENRAWLLASIEVIKYGCIRPPHPETWEVI